MITLHYLRKNNDSYSYYIQRGFIKINRLYILEMLVKKKIEDLIPILFIISLRGKGVFKSNFHPRINLILLFTLIILFFRILAIAITLHKICYLILFNNNYYIVEGNSKTYCTVEFQRVRIYFPMPASNIILHTTAILVILKMEEAVLLLTLPTEYFAECNTYKA